MLFDCILHEVLSIHINICVLWDTASISGLERVPSLQVKPPALYSPVSMAGFRFKHCFRLDQAIGIIEPPQNEAIPYLNLTGLQLSEDVSHCYTLLHIRIMCNIF